MAHTGKSIGCAHTLMTMLVQAQYPHVLVPELKVLDAGLRQRYSGSVSHCGIKRASLMPPITLQ